MGRATGIIIAAGRGVRMGPEGRLRPKGLLEIGGASLIERSVAALADRGVDRLRLVTGHLGEQYEAVAPRLAVPPEMPHNGEFASTGSLASLALGMEGVEGAVLIAESDVIYERRALADLAPGTDRMVLSGPTGAGDEVYVWTRPDGRGGQRLEDMAKDRARHSRAHAGELVGLLSLSAEGLERLRVIAADLLSADPRCDYETAIVTLARDHPVICPVVPDLAWAEIDTPEMYARAHSVVWPRIRAAEQRPAAARA